MINSYEDAHRKIAQHNAEIRTVYSHRDSGACDDCGTCYSIFEQYFGKETMNDVLNSVEPVELTQKELEEILCTCQSEALDYRDAE